MFEKSSVFHEQVESNRNDVKNSGVGLSKRGGFKCIEVRVCYEFYNC